MASRILRLIDENRRVIDGHYVRKHRYHYYCINERIHRCRAKYHIVPGFDEVEMISGSHETGCGAMYDVNNYFLKSVIEQNFGDISDMPFLPEYESLTNNSEEFKKIDKFFRAGYLPSQRVKQARVFRVYKNNDSEMDSDDEVPHEMAWFGVKPHQALDKIVNGTYTSPSPVKPYSSGCFATDVSTSALIYASPHPSMPYAILLLCKLRTEGMITVHTEAEASAIPESQPIRIKGRIGFSEKRETFVVPATVPKFDARISSFDMKSTSTFEQLRVPHESLRIEYICLIAVDKWNEEFLFDGANDSIL